jgi:hypothetical protein
MILCNICIYSLIMIFSCDYAYTYQFVVLKKVKSVLKMKKIKIKINVLPPRGTAVGACRRGAGRHVLAPCHTVLAPEVLSCRRAPRR